MKEIMNGLIEANYNLRHGRPFNARYMIPPYQYLKEFCTISVNYGRQTGKTSWIISHAKENDVVVVRNMATADMYYSNGCKAKRIFSYGSLNNLIMRGRRDIFVNMYVDDYSNFQFSPLVYMDSFIHEVFYNEHLEQTIFLIG